jgi:hypothetical protein
MYEFALNPFDTDLNIDWQLNLFPQSEATMSIKDSSAPNLATLKSTGKLPQHEM